MITLQFSFSQANDQFQSESLSKLHTKAVNLFHTGDTAQGKKLFVELLDKSRKRGNEEAEADLWLEFAKLISSRDTAGITRRFCYEKMVILYKKAGKEQKEIEALKSIADLNLIHGKLDLAEAQLLNVLKRYKAIGYPKLYYVYDLLAVTNRYKGDFSKGIQYAFMAIQGMEAAKDLSPATTFYSRLANMYRELGQTEKSVEWYWKVFRVREYKELVNLYMFRDAGFLARELIKLKREKEALDFILDINAKNKPNGVYAKSSLLASLGFCYHAMRQDQQADKYYSQLIKLTRQLENDNEVTTDVHFEVGKYLMNNGKYRQAATFLQKALNALHGINSLSDTKDIYMMLYKADSAAGNYHSAMQHLMKHKVLDDSIFNETKSRQIEELHVQYKMKERERDIEWLNNQNKQAHKIKNIALASAALLLVVIGLLFNSYLSKQRSNRRLEIHQKEIDQKNAYLEALNAELEQLLKDKEWLIDEVQHRVKNNLQMVTSLLHTQSAYLKDEAAVVAVKDSLRRMQAMSLIHQQLYNGQDATTIEMPKYAGELLHSLRESFEIDSKITVTLAIEPLQLEVSQAVPLGLIINEGVSNAIKFAFSKGEEGIVHVSLQRDGADDFVLKIRDNGVGLPSGFDLANHYSLGINLMEGLSKQLKGSFCIENNNGVLITVRFIGAK
ncbi:sensor histidine kinase [Dyadobacter chenhuakuii]|uniref:histidine kinase n=1 Tax=Dyadobacter chenhuakuii TaxID=2909339 RepID=A0A9X1TYZ4_9BACT|nr:sensor histidine kinase [Dyadobacter chenhuakuii]MCF2496736.1 sensor histidine kinase [Dyadobacter chenhuakuii]